MSEWVIDSLKKFWLTKSKILFFSVFYIGFLLNKMSDSLIPSFLVSELLRSLTKMSDVSKSLRPLTKNERCEQIAQVAHQKWATMSNLLSWLTKNEQMSKSFVFLSESPIRSFFRKKREIHSKNQWTNSQPWLPYT